MNTRFIVILCCASGTMLYMGCQNTMFIGEQHGINLSIEAKNDATEPAKFNFGFESHVAIVVPPRNPIPGNFVTHPWNTIIDYSDPKNVPKGDLLSSISKFRLVHTGTNALTGTAMLSGSTLAIQSLIVTGKAAEVLAAKSPNGTGIGASAAKITQNPNSR